MCFQQDEYLYTILTALARSAQNTTRKQYKLCGTNAPMSVVFLFYNFVLFWFSLRVMHALSRSNQVPRIALQWWWGWTTAVLNLHIGDLNQIIVRRLYMLWSYMIDYVELIICSNVTAAELERSFIDLCFASDLFVVVSLKNFMHTKRKFLKTHARLVD